jgi:hypothetical protein
MSMNSIGQTRRRGPLFPDEIRTHDIHVGNVNKPHYNPLPSINLSFEQFPKHKMCAKLFALPGMNWQDVASAALMIKSRRGAFGQSLLCFFLRSAIFSGRSPVILFQIPIHSSSDQSRMDFSAGTGIY